MPWPSFYPSMKLEELMVQVEMEMREQENQEEGFPFSKTNRNTAGSPGGFISNASLCFVQASTLPLLSKLRTLSFCEKNNKDAYMPINGR